MESLDLHQLKLFQRGDERGMAAAYKCYRTKLLTFALCIVKDQFVAEDIVNDSFLKVWRLRQQVATESGLKGLLFTVTRNACFNHLRDMRLRKQAAWDQLLLPEPSEEAAFMIYEENEMVAAMYRQIESLSPQTRKVLLLKLHNRLSNEEIAALLEITIATVEKHWSNGRRQLVDYFKDKRFLPLLIAMLHFFQ